MFLMFSDSKITQWEDPRLQNPAITGPVSSLLFLPFIGAVAASSTPFLFIPYYCGVWRLVGMSSLRFRPALQ